MIGGKNKYYKGIRRNNFFYRLCHGIKDKNTTINNFINATEEQRAAFDKWGARVLMAGGILFLSFMAYNDFKKQAPKTAALEQQIAAYEKEQFAYDYPDFKKAAQSYMLSRFENDPNYYEGEGRLKYDGDTATFTLVEVLNENRKKQIRFSLHYDFIKRQVVLDGEKVIYDSLYADLNKNFYNFGVALEELGKELDKRGKNANKHFKKGIEELMKK